MVRDRNGVVRSPSDRPVVTGVSGRKGMAGVWKKTLNYLGLVEDDEEFVDEMPEVGAGAGPADAAPGRCATCPRKPRGSSERSPRLASATASSAIHKSEPKRFNEAREVADRFKEGAAVIMNLQSTEDAIARRLVDFASGLVYGLDGKIELVANRVYLLTPATSRCRRRTARRSRASAFYNQF